MFLFNSCGIRGKYHIIPPIRGGAIQMTHEKIKGLELTTLELKAWTQITANKKSFLLHVKKSILQIFGEGEGVDMGSGNEHLSI